GTIVATGTLTCLYSRRGKFTIASLCWRWPVPVGSAVHERTFALCESLSYREWAGYYAVSVYETHHEHEYNAIRNAAALIDVTPLYKYMVTGRDAAKLVN